MRIIDNFLDWITMYRLVLYYLILLLVVAVGFSYFHFLSFDPIALIGSTLFLVIVSWITNKLFASIFHVPTNVESVHISALILALIITPAKSFPDVMLLFWAAVLTNASKYILNIKGKHIFNPVAIAVTMTSFAFGGSASWWVGTTVMLPFSLLGLLIVRKIRRFDLVFYFFVGTLITMCSFTLLNGTNLFTTLQRAILYSPIFFFASIMLTEPFTTPPTKMLQSWYGVFVGVLYAPQFHIGSFFTTPEQALVIGNIFSYLVSPKEKLMLFLKKKLIYGKDIIDFQFILNNKLTFIPGQYMEWTLPHKSVDDRGNRRYFTIASSPTEDTLHLGIKFYPNGSSYKKKLLDLDSTTPLVGAQLAGDFTLSKDPTRKYVFLAGGIGITPFRSIIKYLVDTKQKRDIILFYSNKLASEITFADVFTQAEEELGISTIYTLTDTTAIPIDWKGKSGRITGQMIQQMIPDYQERFFYLSGPPSMVHGFEDMLKSIGVKSKQIKKDFFPGFV